MPYRRTATQIQDARGQSRVGEEGGRGVGGGRGQRGRCGPSGRARRNGWREKGRAKGGPRALPIGEAAIAAEVLSRERVVGYYALIQLQQKDFFNKAPSHDTGHGTGAHWH